MRIVRLTLIGPPGRIANQADAELIHDALWAHSRPGAEVAHVTTTALPHGIDVAIFLHADIADPEQRVAALLSSISRKSAILRPWLGEFQR